MRNYTVTAHNSTSNHKFHLTFDAFSSNHAGAMFIAEMKRRNHPVIINRLVGDPIFLSHTADDLNPVIIDRIQPTIK